MIGTDDALGCVGGGGEGHDKSADANFRTGGAGGRLSSNKPPLVGTV